MVAKDFQVRWYIDIENYMLYVCSYVCIYNSDSKQESTKTTGRCPIFSWWKLGKPSIFGAKNLPNLEKNLASPQPSWTNGQLSTNQLMLWISPMHTIPKQVCTVMNQIINHILLVIFKTNCALVSMGGLCFEVTGFHATKIELLRPKIWKTRVFN